MWKEASNPAATAFTIESEAATAASGPATNSELQRKPNKVKSYQSSDQEITISGIIGSAPSTLGARSYSDWNGAKPPIP